MTVETQSHDFSKYIGKTVYDRVSRECFFVLEVKVVALKGKLTTYFRIFREDVRDCPYDPSNRKHHAHIWCNADDFEKHYTIEAPIQVGDKFLYKDRGNINTVLFIHNDHAVTTWGPPEYSCYEVIRVRDLQKFWVRCNKEDGD